jgi:tetratricopeptide (TPR) repeat protein
MTNRSFSLGMLAVALGAAAAGVASRFPVAQQRPYDLAGVPRSDTARWTSLGHPTLVANLWWLRAVQYMGDPAADQRGWEMLYPAVNLVTDLDPGHGYAYQVAGIVLGGAGRVEESNALFEKGARLVPDRYILSFQRAVNAFLYQGDYAAAAQWFERASRVPGAPAARMRAYAAAMFVKGDQHDRAVALLTESLAAAEDEETRRNIREQLDQVELEQRADVLERAAAVYRTRHGAPPVNLLLLVADGLIPALPVDPFGGRLYLDDDGRVRSTVHPRRYERPDSAQRAPAAAPLAPAPETAP